MKKTFTFIFALSIAMVQAADFTPGNVVVALSGSGTSTSNSVPVQLLEYNTTTANQASAVQTINLNSTAGSPMLTLGSNPGEGQLSLSEDGKLLLLQGYDAIPGTASGTHRATNKSIAKIGPNGVPAYISIAYGSGTTSRNTVSIDGSAFWNLMGNTAVSYFSSSDPSTITGTIIGNSGTFYRSLRIFKNKLYLITGDILTYSNTELPTTTASATTALTLPNGGSAISAVGFQFFDVDATADWNGTGYDLLYISDVQGGLRKLYYNTTTSAWTHIYQYTYNNTAPWGYTSIAGRIEDGKPVLYVAQASSSSALLYGNKLLKIVDNGAYNAAISSTVTELATAPANYAFRGITFAPQANPSTSIEKNVITTKILSSKGGINIQSANKQAYKILNTLGQTIAKGIVSGDNQFVPVKSNGILFVQINKQVTKVLLAN